MTPKRVRTVEGSCWACKDRRVICDLQRPQCRRCLAEDQVCEYGKLRLRWCNGVAARGRFAGQNVPISSDPQQQQFQTLLDAQTYSPSRVQEEESESERDRRNSQYQDGNQDNERYEEYLAQGQSQSLSLRSRSSQNRHASNILGMSSFVTAEQLMLYFERIVIDRFSLSSEPVIVDLSSVYKSPALRYSVTAVANAHQQLSLYSSRPRSAILCKRSARLRAIQNVRTLLQSPSEQLTVSRHFLALGLFIASVLLCILDGVIEPHDENAAAYVHYRGGRAILSQWKLQQQLLRHKRGLPALMLSCFATMDLTYSLLSGEEQYFQHTTWAHFAGSEGWWGVLPYGDPFLDIMQSFSRLAQLGHRIYEEHGGQMARATDSAIEEEVDILLSALRGYVVTPADAPDQLALVLKGHCVAGHDTNSGDIPLAPDLLSPMYSSHSSLNHEQSWIVYCNAYRLAGLIYIYRVFHNLDVTHQLVQQATSLGIKAICEPRLNGKLVHCLLFPALVIGAHCRTKTQQKEILNATQTTAAFLQFGSLQVMESFLQKVWTQTSSSSSSSNYDTLEVEPEAGPNAETWWEFFEPISKKTFLF